MPLTEATRASSLVHVEPYITPELGNSHVKDDLEGSPWEWITQMVYVL
jgi:hypothetical protein